MTRMATRRRLWGLVAIVSFLAIVSFGLLLRPPPASTRPDAAEVRIRVVTTLRTDARAVMHIRSALPSAWSTATGQRGRLEIIDTDPDLTIYVMSESGVVATYQDPAHHGTAITMLYLGSPPVLRYGPVIVTLHEIAHLWCCHAGGVPDGHWPDDAEPGLMNASLYGQDSGIFSQRELRELGLIR